MYFDAVIIMLNVLYLGFTLIAVLRAGVINKNRLAAFAIFLLSTIVYLIAFYLILLSNKML